MATRVVNGLAELKSLVGQRLGTSDWVVVDQTRINTFAQATGDHQWIHCDEARAARESQYGTTIAHGYLTLSLGPVLAAEIMEVRGIRLVLNYGLNRVRFPAPVLSGAHMRLHLDLLEFRMILGAAQAVFRLTFEAEGQSKPVCVAESIVRYYP